MVDRYDEELFLEYVEGELPHEKRVAFENQMLQDPRLRNLVAQMVLDRHRLRTLPDEAPPPHLMDAVHERLERAMLLGAGPETFSQPAHPSLRGFRWRRFATLAAMAAMFAVVAGVFVVTLVTLSNDAPIRQTGPASLNPPGLLGGTPTLPPARVKPPVEPAPEQPATTDTAAVTPTDPPAATVETPVAVAPAATTSPQPPAVDAQPATPALPAADRVMRLAARDLPSAQRRFEGWVLAYEAKVLDQRAGSTEASAATTADRPKISQPGGANQPLQIDGEKAPVAPSPSSADQVVASVTLSLPAGLLSHLRTFVSSLPGTTVEEWAVPAALLDPGQPSSSPSTSPLPSPSTAALQAGARDDAMTADWAQSLITSSPGLPSWLTVPWQSDAAAVAPPLRLEEPTIEPATPASAPTDETPDPVVVRVEWVQR